MHPYCKAIARKSQIKAGIYAWLLTVGLALLSGLVLPAFADHALVVGVNLYPNLPKDKQLGGPVNDARAMAKKLKTLGFSVTTLTDTQATKAGVLAALDQMETINTAGERFVFYFAGHGAKRLDGSGAILASDADPRSKTNYLAKDDLYVAVAAVPAKGRTVLLDCCFSGAMQRALGGSKGLHPARKSRYYDFFGLDADGGVHAKQLEPINNQDDPLPVDASPGAAATNAVCYFVAANSYQPAFEDEIDGKQDGLFTHYLLAHLNGKWEAWQTVQTDVTGSVMGMTDGSQTPCLTASYGQVGIFDGPGELAPSLSSRQARSVWDAFSEDRKDANHIALAMTPNQSIVAIKEQFQFQATVGSEGYLIILELDTDGNLDLVSPASRNVLDAYVPRATVFTLPGSGNAFTVDKEGAERVKAILFSSQDAAKQLLAAFSDTGSLASWRKARDQKIMTTNVNPFFTSAVGFVVSGTN